jgi:hypothetical protein
VTLPNPEFRRRVRALAESQWHEPVVVVYLEDVKPEFDVPGRRKDGTVKGRRLVRRFFWNIFRGTVGGLVSAVLSIGGGGAVHVFVLFGRVTGTENAQALGLVDAARPAKAPWLVYSPSHVAVVDSGYTFYDPADSPPPTLLWHAARPHAPLVSPTHRRLTWPDGSVFEYHLSGPEANFLKQSHDVDLGRDG